MTEKKKQTGGAGAERHAETESGATTLTEESLSTVTGGAPDGRVNPKKKKNVQAYPAVE